MADAEAAEVEADDVVHMFWIGEGPVPDFPRKCIASYAAVGNCVNLWLYPQQRTREEAAAAVPKGAILRDANDIITLEKALEIGYFHGMGPDLDWPGWSTFADLFRYELLFREGGWWCDADSIAVRRLADAGFPPGAHVLATERWRPGGYRNIILAIPKPCPEADRLGLDLINGGSREEAKAFREAQDAQLVDCCVLTNSHIRAPKGSKLMRACADELRPLMETYAQQCKDFKLGDESVEWGLPTGGEGLRIIQEQAAARIMEGGAEGQELLAAICHYACFNPVEIDDFPGGMRVLNGERAVPAVTCTIHLFGMMRANWKVLKLEMPEVFKVEQEATNQQLLTEIRKVEAQKIKAERERKKREAAEKREIAEKQQ